MLDVRKVLAEAEADRERAGAVFEAIEVEKRELDHREHKARWELTRLQKLCESLREIIRHDREQEGTP